ncbi:uncharacterized protein A1O9_10448 [Exophiala aquamarina CBS 119918]|uniref:Indole-diterpene biosynthesis protein PaxU n=1 Tax=Exophiala aquamarina CBS 119918 TaxID=1182545 RepID=A0A072P2G3_9EURO|nr:uncharacterized protein A1O9_10448 [Exophiala aquamarina CBS 119918]KEF53473.1 hypothetical protein A1O9_10448 [Exophiala aquamarina CBS 119918]
MEFSGPEPELQPVKLDADSHLPDFQRLGKQLFYYVPSTPAAETQSCKSTKGPDLLIVCSWMGASSRNVRKYLSTYQTLFPATPILLLKQDGGDFFWRSKSTLAENVQPAVLVIKDIVEAKRTESPRILVHLFSNGGAFSAINLTTSYHTSMGEHVPISALILDSTPSLPDPRRAHEAISESLPRSGPFRLLGQAALWAYIGGGITIDSIFRTENVTLWLRRMLNDPQGAFMQGDLKRVYIYSKADRLVPWADVEAHARDAEAIIGPARVQLEDFITSRHVGHILVDGPRYWNIVVDFWKETMNG